ncbi:peptidase dimerization domain-containing protein [Candidatus Sumerlaeota bacterium]|nr:peptidase dimerization domain-containing protein [Candidatus Sumerlaeota bacterium]
MLPEIQKALEESRENLLASLVIISEIPAPTFQEAARIQYLKDRFTEYGLTNYTCDETGNGSVVIDGATGERNILILAHVDTVHKSSVDHTVTVLPDIVFGPGVGDNSLGVAMLATLPLILEKINYQFHSNLILMGAVRSLGRGNLEGQRFFLNNVNRKIDAGICVEGLKLGRLSYKSLGMRRGQFNVTVPQEAAWHPFGTFGAVRVMNQVINRLNQIPLPTDPRSTIILGSIDGGESYNTLATKATLRFEVRSESDRVPEEVEKELRLIAEEVASESGAEVKMDIFAQRLSGGIHFSHPLVHATRSVMDALDIEPIIRPSTSEISEFINHGIPAVTLGITECDNLGQPDETIYIEPIIRGAAQIIGVLIAIDQGAIDEY